MADATPELVLGIESSCDEMAAAVVRRGREVLASRVQGQHDLHRPYGGVVPEIASSDHVRQVSDVVAAALADAGVPAEALSAVGMLMADSVRDYAAGVMGRPDVEARFRELERETRTLGLGYYADRAKRALEPPAR